MEEVKDDDIDKMFLQLQKELKKIKPETELQGNRPQERSGLHGPGFVLELPNGFEEIDRDKAASIFYSKNRPEIVLINQFEHAGITIQTVILENEITSMDLEGERERVRQIVRQADGKNVFYDQGNIPGDTPVMWFDYKSFAADERVYNMMFLFLSGGKLVIGTFYCIFKDYDRWRPIILNMLGTIRTEEAEHERI